MSAVHPSGEWVGYYTYDGIPKKCPMHLTLRFDANRVHGAGLDGAGQFIVNGNYDDTSARVTFSKQYIGKHAVEYEGRFQADEILGHWSLKQGERTLRGDVRLWPLPADAYSDDEPLQKILEQEIQRRA